MRYRYLLIPALDYSRGMSCTDPIHDWTGKSVRVGIQSTLDWRFKDFIDVERDADLAGDDAAWRDVVVAFAQSEVDRWNRGEVTE